MIEIIKDTLIDSIKLLPFLFITYILMEYIEHKMGKKSNVALDNMFTQQQYIDILYNLSLSTIKWKNLPDTCCPLYLEKCLFYEGKAIFFYDDILGFLNMKFTMGGGFDIYKEPIIRYAFADNDLRKKEWMLIGPQYDYKTGEPVVGTSEYSGQPLVFVKDIKRFSEGKTEESTMYTGEENSGARFDKYKTGASGDPNYWGNDWVFISFDRNLL